MATVVESALPGPELAKAAPNPAKIARRGLLGGLVGAFVIAIGMFQTFDGRILIVPVLSLGFVALYWVPVLFGFLASSDLRAPSDPGGRPSVAQVAVGASTGALAGAAVWLFGLIFSTGSLSDIFIRLTERASELLTFGRGFGFALIVLVGGWALLGAIGGALAGASPRLRHALVGAVVWTFGAAVLELVVEDVLDEVGLSFVSRFLYEINGGMKIPGAIVVMVLAGLASWAFRGGFSRARTRIRNLEGPARRKYGLIGGAGALVVIVVLPMLLGSLVNELLANVALFLLMGLGLNIVIGYAGLLDLGYVAFFAVGAYTTAILTSPISPRFAPMLTLDFTTIDGWIIFGTVLLAATLAGILIGTPVIRMRGDYLAIVTLGFGEIVRILFLSDWLAPTFGGAQGVRQIPPAELGLVGVEIAGINPQSIVYFVAVFVVIAVYVSYRLSKSRLGRAWSALREDESVAEAMGIDTVKVKLLAFVIGAILASFAGMVFAVKVGSVFPNSFALLVSIIVLVVVIVGGMGNIPGVAVGALVLIGVLGGPTQPGVLQEFQEFKLLIYGALLVFMMLKRPEGLLPSVRRSRELHQDEFLQDAWLDPADATESDEDRA